MLSVKRRPPSGADAANVTADEVCAIGRHDALVAEGHRAASSRLSHHTAALAAEPDLA
jgi:hypothetical protein